MENALLAEPLQRYLDSLVPARPEEMQKMEAYAKETNFPIIGPACGYLCYQIARMIGAREVFELGSGFGYSTAWFAKAVLENGGGSLYHVVWDRQLSQRAQGHLGVLGFGKIIKYRIGEAVKALRETPGPFDLIFNDIDKEGYPDALPVIAEKLRSGGVMIVDNLLWGGRVFDQNDRDVSTEGIRELTRHVNTDPTWIASVVPIRDGLLLAYKL